MSEQSYKSSPKPSHDSPKHGIKREKQSSTTANVAKVLRYCKRWRVPVILVDQDSRGHGRLPDGREVADTHMGPSDGSICWPERTILWPRSGGVAHALLHELNHVLMDVDPDEIDEVASGLLALDAYGSRALRLQGWSEWMARYTVDSTDWLDVTTHRRGKLLRASLADAVRLGLLDAAGRPTFRRQVPTPT